MLWIYTFLTLLIVCYVYWFICKHNNKEGEIFNALCLCFTLKVMKGSGISFCFPDALCVSVLQVSLLLLHPSFGASVRFDPAMNNLPGSTGRGYRDPTWRGGAVPSCSDWPEKMFYGAPGREAGQWAQPERGSLLRLTDSDHPLLWL